MARPGDALENPTGERLVFRKTGAETNGEALEYEIVFTPLAALGRLLGYRGTYSHYSGGT